MKYLLFPCLLLATPMETFAGETTFVVGSRPWNFTPRSRENHLSMQMRGPDSAQAAANGAGVAAGYPGYPVASTSYAVGNWVQIEMNLGDGAEGLVMVENHQTNQGNQQSLSDALGEIMEIYQTDASAGTETVVE